MTVTVEQVLHKIRETNECKLTGSFVIGGFSKESDIDIVVNSTDVGSLFLNALEKDFKCQFFYTGSAGMDNDTESWKAFDVISGRDLNLILVYKEERYRAWALATKVARQLELHEKPHRVACFEYFKCGGQPIEEESTPF